MAAATASGSLGTTTGTGGGAARAAHETKQEVAARETHTDTSSGARQLRMETPGWKPYQSPRQTSRPDPVPPLTPRRCGAAW